MAIDSDDEEEKSEEEDGLQNAVHILSRVRADLAALRTRFSPEEHVNDLETFEDYYNVMERTCDKLETEIKRTPPNSTPSYAIFSHTNDLGVKLYRLLSDVLKLESKRSPELRDNTFIASLEGRLHVQVHTDEKDLVIDSRPMSQEVHKYPTASSHIVVAASERKITKSIAELRADIKQKVDRLTERSTKEDLINLLKEYQIMRTLEGTHLFGFSKAIKLGAVANAIHYLEGKEDLNPDLLAAQQDKLLGSILKKGEELNLIGTNDYFHPSQKN